MTQDRREELQARSETLMRNLIGHAEGTHSLFDALQYVTRPDARIHLQNGEVTGPEVSNRHAAIGSVAFPDMEVEIEDTLQAEDWLVVRLRITGRSAAGVPFMPSGFSFEVGGMFVARVAEDAMISELWVFANPGFSFSFPPRRVYADPPPLDGATEESARVLYQAWMQRAEAGEDFVRAVAASLAEDGVVHLGNGDSGHAEVLEDLFARIASGLHDMSLEVEEVLFAGAHVVVLFQMSGIHGGQLGIFPGTGRTLPSTGALVARANRRGEAAEVWVFVAPGYSITLPPRRP